MKFFTFLICSLPSVSPPALGKQIFFIFFNKFFAECPGSSTQQRNFFIFICSLPGALAPALDKEILYFSVYFLPSAMALTLSKEIFYFFICFLPSALAPSLGKDFSFLPFLPNFL